MILLDATPYRSSTPPYVTTLYPLLKSSFSTQTTKYIKLLFNVQWLVQLTVFPVVGFETHLFAVAGIPESKLVEAHGTFSTASCIRCHKSYDGEKIRVCIVHVAVWYFAHTMNLSPVTCRPFSLPLDTSHIVTDKCHSSPVLGLDQPALKFTLIYLLDRRPIFWMATGPWNPAI